MKNTLLSLINDNTNDSSDNKYDDNKPVEILNELKNVIEKTSDNIITNQQDNIELFTSDGDPTQAQVDKQCDNIVVNDITIPVDVPNELSTNTPTLVKDKPAEDKYDNVDLFVNKPKNDNKFNKLLNSGGFLI